MMAVGCLCQGGDGLTYKRAKSLTCIVFPILRQARQGFPCLFHPVEIFLLFGKILKKYTEF